MNQEVSNLHLKGLTDKEVLLAREHGGANTLTLKKENQFLYVIKGIAKEPMVILLIAASALYLMSGNFADGFFLATAIILVAAISFFQDSRSRNALEKLKKFTQPISKVIRNGQIKEISTEELVTGDLQMLEEGKLIAADGIIIHSNDFSVDESILTGESLAVYKEPKAKDNLVYQGTSVASGLAIARITHTGNDTKLAQIGESLQGIKDEKTPLELQIGQFVKKMIIAGAFFFVFVWLVNYLKSNDVLSSLLKALTLAMSILPEEIPVAFTTFMALGAWRLMKMGIVVRDMKTVETLGSASVICVDKTGTITQNKMALAKVYVLETNQIHQGAYSDLTVQNLILDAMWASEPIPFDPMEVAIHDIYHKTAVKDQRSNFHMLHEYPLGGKPPMMTHIFQDKAGTRIIAAKGAPEAFIDISGLNEKEKDQIREAVKTLGSDGYRLLGVGTSSYAGSTFPANQRDLGFRFTGLIAFYDPPKENIAAVLQDFYKAGIAVKIVTGDNPLTTAAIARQVGFRGYEKSITGEELMQLDEAALDKVVADKNIFTRMFPEAKLRIINSLKAQGEVVAMTGDGVNDGPALKAAHIGIAMGKKGTEIAKEAASMILIEDDLGKMVDAIRMGRKIYSNLKKAIQYVISIHIPIILIVFIPLTMGWVYPAIFSPVHVIFLELIMGPTCSIIYENEPVEANTMIRKPRPITDTFFNIQELSGSVIQGLVITAGLLYVYQYSISQNSSENITRTMVFFTLIIANIFLTLTNRSFYYSILKTLTYRNNLVLYIIFLTVLISVLLIYTEPFSAFFKFGPLKRSQLGVSLCTGFISVIWIEIIKWYNRKKNPVEQEIIRTNHPINE